MANLRPFRDYDEKDVINLFALDTSSGMPTNFLTAWSDRVTKGTLVKLSNTGWHNSDELEMIGSAGTLDPANVTSQRYGVKAKVEIAGANDAVFGMMLHDVATVDENGEQLKFNPRKASELEACIAGQAVPIVQRGIFLLESASLGAETFNAGAPLSVASGGEWTAGNIASDQDTIVGRALGSGYGSANASAAAGNLVLVQLNIGSTLH
tara:strand:- start:3516 stop:4142 length:627 start_codon:yes stop_codon:yes gene_type:complete